MIFSKYNRTINQVPAGKRSSGAAEAKAKAEEVLIEEILLAAGLEALD